MLSLPHELTQYWLTHSLEESSPAYFQVTDTGLLMSWGGAVERYDAPLLEKGQFIGDIFPFLSHSFPMQNLTESMQWIETESGLILDAHFCFAETDGWILFVESGEEAHKVQRLMQQGNELKLLRQKYDKMVQRQLERTESSLILETLLELPSDRTPKGLSILQIRLNLSVGEGEGANQDSLEQLNQLLKAIFQAAVEEGGVIHHVFGQTVAILFGLLPSPLASAQQAIQAAHQLVTQCKKTLSFPHPQTLTLGIGITTGQLDIDIRPVKNRKIFHIIGQTIVRAEEILLMLQPGFLIIDQNTFDRVQDDQHYFSRWQPDESFASCKGSFYAQSLNE